MTFRPLLGLAAIFFAACAQTNSTSTNNSAVSTEQEAEKVLKTGARAVVMQAAKTPVRVATAAVTVEEKIEEKLENKPADSSGTN